MSESPTGVELSAFLRQIGRGVRPADIMEAIAGRVRRVVSTVHREGALPQDYSALERTHGSLSRTQDGYVRPKVTIAPTALVPDEWVRDGVGATVWLPVSTLFDIGHQADGLPGPLPPARR